MSSIIPSYVSIHAPAWGATQAFGNLLYYYYVSIHAPAWGATGREAIWNLLWAEFQSTRPHGARPQELQLHALKGKSFNPRARMGRDDALKAEEAALYSFNPRARMGRDLIEIRTGAGESVSIHAPAWGATRRILARWMMG